MVSLPILGGIFSLLANVTPGIGILLIKAYLMFALFVWVRASLHRIRTDQILEFGWRYLLPLSLVNLAMAMVMRVALWNGSWPIWLAPLMTIGSILVFVVLAIDEDKEALENSNRIYHTQTLDKAYPGRRD